MPATSHLASWHADILWTVVEFTGLDKLTAMQSAGNSQGGKPNSWICAFSATHISSFLLKVIVLNVPIKNKKVDF